MDFSIRRISKPNLRSSFMFARVTTRKELGLLRDPFFKQFEVGGSPGMGTPVCLAGDALRFLEKGGDGAM